MAGINGCLLSFTWYNLFQNSECWGQETPVLCSRAELVLCSVWRRVHTVWVVVTNSFWQQELEATRPLYTLTPPFRALEATLRKASLCNSQSVLSHTEIVPLTVRGPPLRPLSLINTFLHSTLGCVHTAVKSGQRADFPHYFLIDDWQFVSSDCGVRNSYRCTLLACFLRYIFEGFIFTVYV